VLSLKSHIKFSNYNSISLSLFLDKFEAYFSLLFAFYFLGIRAVLLGARLACNL